VAPRRRKEDDDTCWADANLTQLKNKEKSRSRFNCYK
jgi:hypothetical protein